MFYISIYKLLNIENSNLDKQKFLKHKKNFIKSTNFSLLLNKIESGEKRKDIIREIKNKDIKFINLCVLLILSLFPFNKKIMKLYTMDSNLDTLDQH